jgi:DNA-binding CsgD family transcriptional regulator
MGTEYFSVQQIARRWGITPRQAQRLLARGRVPGAKRHGRSWLIPAEAEKPRDLRRAPRSAGELLADELDRVIAATTLPLPTENPAAFWASLAEDKLRLLYEAELAYLRADFTRALASFQATKGEEACRLRACPVAIAAAISLGDYPAYTEIESYLKECRENYPGGVGAFAELALATAAVSVMAPNMAPEWLKKGDFSALPLAARPDALYLRAKYFQCIGNYEAMLAVAQTALALCPHGQGFTLPDLYLRVVCAMACHALDREEEGRSYLLEAMNLALPRGFTTPFAEVITALGGLMEQCLERAHPGCYRTVIGQWKQTWKNWIQFHNQFTKDNITLILSLREYHITVLVARRVPYAKIAQLHGISVGRLKNIVLDIHGKLFISSRDELAKYIL